MGAFGPIYPTTKEIQMIGRRATVGLSLLCALAFCAFAAQSASAAKAVNTTAFTCVEGATKDFSDAHCDTKVTAGTGQYGHVVIPQGTTTEVVGENTTTGGAIVSGGAERQSLWRGRGNLMRNG